MFSGIIKSVGKIQLIEKHGTSLRITVSSDLSDSLHIDQSVSHDGVCLTIIKAGDGVHQVEVVKETLSKSTFANAHTGQLLNLEKSITASSLLDGHLVQGHVDTTFRCTSVENLQGSWKFSFELNPSFANLIIPQGSICLNGVSLTVSDLNVDSFSVSIIPYTYAHTNFGSVKAGDHVNVEFDLIGKYIIRQMELRYLSE